MGAGYVFLKDVAMTYVATKIAWQGVTVIVLAILHHI
jgi:hypothetical protein